MQVVARDDLKEYTVEDFRETGTDLWYFKPAGGGPEEKNEVGTLVEAVLDHRVYPDGTLEFLVKWSGKPDTQNTWEPIWSFNKCCNAWVDYCAKRGMEFEAWELMPWPPETQEE